MKLVRKYARMQVCKYFESKHFRPKSYLAKTFSNRAYPAACASSELLRACSYGCLPEHRLFYLDCPIIYHCNFYLLDHGMKMCFVCCIVNRYNDGGIENGTILPEEGGGQGANIHSTTFNIHCCPIFNACLLYHKTEDQSLTHWEQDVKNKN